MDTNDTDICIAMLHGPEVQAAAAENTIETQQLIGSQMRDQPHIRMGGNTGTTAARQCKLLDGTNEQSATVEGPDVSWRGTVRPLEEYKEKSLDTHTYRLYLIWLALCMEHNKVRRAIVNWLCTHSLSVLGPKRKMLLFVSYRNDNQNDKEDRYCWNERWYR